MLYQTTLQGTLVVDLRQIHENADGTYMGLTMPPLSDEVMHSYFPGREQHLWEGRFVGIECFASEWMEFLKDAAREVVKHKDDPGTARAMDTIALLTNRMHEYLIAMHQAPFKGPDDFERLVA